MAQSRIVAIDAQDSEAPEGSNDTMVEGFIYRDSTADFPCEIVTVGYMGGQPPVGLLMHQNQATGFKVYTICGRTTGPWSMGIYKNMCV